MGGRGWVRGGDGCVMVVSRPQHLVEGVDDVLEGVMGGRGWIRGTDGCVMVVSRPQHLVEGV